MKILANLGKLKDGRTALVIEDAYKPNFVIVSGFDPATGTWSSGGKYFDGNLTAFCKEITDVNCVIGYERMKQIAQTYISNDAEAADSSYVYDVLTGTVGMDLDEMKELGFGWIHDANN